MCTLAVRHTHRAWDAPDHGHRVRDAREQPPAAAVAHGRPGKRTGPGRNAAQGSRLSLASTKQPALRLCGHNLDTRCVDREWGRRRSVRCADSDAKMHHCVSPPPKPALLCFRCHRGRASTSGCRQAIAHKRWSAGRHPLSYDDSPHGPPERGARDSISVMTHGDSRVPGRRPRRCLLARREQRLRRCAVRWLSDPPRVGHAA